MANRGFRIPQLARRSPIFATRSRTNCKCVFRSHSERNNERRGNNAQPHEKLPLPVLRKRLRGQNKVLFLELKNCLLGQFFTARRSNGRLHCFSNMLKRCGLAAGIPGRACSCVQRIDLLVIIVDNHARTIRQRVLDPSLGAIGRYPEHPDHWSVATEI